jgi:hypothetical protein
MDGAVEMVGNKEARLYLDHGAGFAKSRFGGLQVLIANGELLFQGVQLGIAEKLPPVAANGLVAGLRGLPPVALLEGGRRRFFEGRGDGAVGVLYFGPTMHPPSINVP